MAGNRAPASFPGGLATALTLLGIGLVVAGLWVVRSSVVPASNGEGNVPGMVGSIALQVLAGLAAVVGFLLVVWMVIQLAGRLPPERGTEDGIDARVRAALAKDGVLGPSDPLAVPSGLPWERV